VILFPKNIFEKIGFDDVLVRLKEKTLSADLRDKLSLIQPLTFTQIAESRAVFLELIEFRKENSTPSHIRVPSFQQFGSAFRIKNASLTVEQVENLFQVVENHGYWELKTKAEFKLLNSLLPNGREVQVVFSLLSNVLNKRGKFDNSASQKLSEISGEISAVEGSISRNASAIFGRLKSEGLATGENLTFRDGRTVIPVPVENKRKIEGFIHDVSATGKTVFIEPKELFEGNNRLRELYFERDSEINRILNELTESLSDYSETIEWIFKSLIKLEWFYVLQQWTKSIDGIFPEVVNQPVINIIDGVHPLLHFHLKEIKKTAVPLSIRLDNKQRVLIISGPNAGGKSVALKTLGVTQLMIQHGIPVIANEKSEFGFFDKILVDLGDDQSLENDLSTYSAHLAAMKYITRQATPDTLVLIDEMGSGTDPHFGAPLAQSILVELAKKNIKGVITTHFSSLKLFADETPGFVNAGMRYDTEKLEPKFELETGKPGSSFAFEIAKNMGISIEVLDRARNLAGEESVDFDDALLQLEKEKKQLEELRLEAEKTKNSFTELKDEYKKLKEDLDSRKKEIIKQANLEAESILNGANKKIENTIRQIKETNADKLETKKARNELLQEKQQIVGKLKKFQEEIETDEKPKVGDKVKLKNSKTTGEIAEIRGKKLVINFNEVKTTLDMDKVVVLKENKKMAPEAKKRFMDLVVSKSKTFKQTLDIRGFRRDEAISTFETYLDEAMLLGMSNLTILHGKGNGVLQKAIWDQLKVYPKVKSYKYAHPDRGGAGITEVILNND
jgi:DNA mismatch repair protein MutS2